ncbi:biogenesis of lysosome-related organelles complex 1 subunit 4-like isoform X2 [Heptranchias perlo]|uniref:biogenesis of lysosome-related organelles complex 1 subunit 4-like isoform X2 n=1 Tax=Heptranchias perlo TaxID=212740 RepID=UPI00355AA2A6
MEEQGFGAGSRAVGPAHPGSPSGRASRQGDGEEDEEEAAEEEGDGGGGGSSSSIGCEVETLSAAAPGEAGAESEQEALLQRTARCYSGYLTIGARQEIQQLETSLEEMLTRVDEFCGMLDMAFVKMIGQNVCVLDDQVTHAEAELGTFPNAFRKILHSIGTPAFLNKSSPPKRQQQKFEPPALFQTKDYFPAHNSQPHE